MQEYEYILNKISDDFGINNDRSQFDINNQIKENDIIEFEERIGSKLPNDYRHFLLKYNGAEVNKCDCKIRKIGEGEEEYFLDFCGFKNLFDIEMDASDIEMIPQTIFIGSTWEKPMYLLSLREKSYGNIYYIYYDDNFTEEDIDNKVGKVSFIEKGFTEFLRKIEIENIKK